MITMDNYEGWLMRYADDALTAAERQQVEVFLAEHPGLREEVEAVASVKVTPVVASMPGKERLLHRQPMAVWHRVAAAVALLVVAGITLLVLHRPEEAPLVAQHTAAPVSPALPARPQEMAAPAQPSTPQPPARKAVAQQEKLESLEKLEILESLEILDDLDNLEPQEAPSLLATLDSMEAPTPNLPRATATLGIVVEDARLASNPWRELLAFNN